MQFPLVVGLTFMAVLVSPAHEHLGKTLAEWQAELANPDQIDRLLAIRAIGEMAVEQRAGTTGAVLEAIQHEDGSVRYWAAVATIHVPELASAAQELLTAVLADPVPEVRIQAAHALIGTTAETAALRTLAELLSHPNRGVRLQAVHAADAIEGKASALVDELQAALDDEFDYVQRVARHALWRLQRRSCPYRECE